MRFTVYGVPIAQGRPRFFRRGNHVGTYDPEESKSWKETIKWQVIEQGVSLIEGAVSLDLTFIFPRPKSLPKRVKDHVKRPDMSNLLKGVEDALNGILWRDDSQINRICMTKEYGDPPRVVIEVSQP